MNTEIDSEACAKAAAALLGVRIMTPVLYSNRGKVRLDAPGGWIFSDELVGDKSVALHQPNDWPGILRTIQSLERKR